MLNTITTKSTNKDSLLTLNRHKQREKDPFTSSINSYFIHSSLPATLTWDRTKIATQKKKRKKKAYEGKFNHRN